jgi:tRNA(Arg) A34 adenosine deaminase TadA
MENKFLDMAINLASENVKSGNGGPFGAIIVKNGEIVATGVNTVTTKNDPTAHAEVNAIRNACSKLDNFQLEGCEIYSSCEPCPMCLGAIYWSHIDKLYYAANKDDAAQAGFDDSFIYKELEVSISDRRLFTKPINLINKLEPFTLWNEMNEKIEY